MLALQLIFNQIMKDVSKFAKSNKLEVKDVEIKPSYLMFDIVGYRSDIEMTGSMSVFWGRDGKITLISRLETPFTDEKKEVVEIDSFKFDTNDVIKTLKKMFPRVGSICKLQIVETN